MLGRRDSDCDVRLLGPLPSLTIRDLYAADLFCLTGAQDPGGRVEGFGREYLLGSMAGELPMPAQTYDALFKTCMATSAMSNVKDVYILRDDGIAVIPKQDSVSSTAATLAQFCNAYPRATLRFITRKELTLAKSTLAIVRMSSGSATSCKQIKGLD